MKRHSTAFNGSQHLLGNIVNCHSSHFEQRIAGVVPGP